MKKLLLLILLCLFGHTYSQVIEGDEKSADEALRSYNFEKAVKLYRDAFTKNSSNLRAKEKLANTLLKVDPKSNEALSILSELTRSGMISKEGLLKYANLLSSTKNFAEASKTYAMLNSSTEGKFNETYFNNISEKNESLKIRNVSEINTEMSDFSPCYYRNGITYVSMVKKRNGTGFDAKGTNFDYFTDVYVAEKSYGDNLKQGSLLLNNVDQKYMQGPMSFTKDYGVMYITRSNLDGDKIKKASDKKTVQLKIYRVNYKSGLNDWSEVTEVSLANIPDAQDYSFAHPAFSADNNTLIFASNMPGGFGGTDLWKVTKIGLGWSSPENLGPNVNTAGEEKFPFLASDNTLYYSTDGIPGLGGLDIYKASFIDNTYSDVTNMGNPINSNSDDFGFIIDKDLKEGYLSSNRVGGRGDDDIYQWKASDMKLTYKIVSCKTKEPIEGVQLVGNCVSGDNMKSDKDGAMSYNIKPIKECSFDLVKENYKKYTAQLKNVNSSKVLDICMEEDITPTMKLEVLVLDKATNLPVPNAEITIKQGSSNDQIASTTKEDGMLKVGGLVSNELYTIGASKVIDQNSRFLSKSEQVNTTGKFPPEVLKVVFYLEKAEVGKAIKIENIYFDLSKWAIRNDAARELDKIVELLFNMPTMEIEMGSHTDCRDTKTKNQVLSEKRAASSVQYIISKGISSSRLKYQGYGEEILTNSCACEGAVKSKCSDYEHQQNRRTEFKILKF